MSIDRRPGWIYSVENANRGEPTTSGQSASNRRHSNSRPLANCPLYGTPNHVRSALARYANNLNVVLARLDSGCVSMSGPSQPIADQRTCLLILGMHRSGTSAITRILNLMGAELPKQLLGALPGNEAGHWEPERLVLLHDQMLAEAGSSWRDLRPLDLARLSADRLAYYKSMIQSIIQDEFGNAFIFALKDPRICRFIPIYRAILSDLGVRTQPIIIVRNPLEVSASLSARDKMSNTHGLLLWLRHCLDIEKHTRDMSRVFVGYDRVVNDIHDVIARLHESLGYLPLSFHPSDITNLVLPSIRHDLRHQISSSDDVDQCALTKTWIKEAYRAFQALSTGEGGESAITCLDTISQEFNNFSSLLAQLADDVDILRIKEQQLEENIHILQDNICHSQYIIEQLHGQIQWNAEQHARALQWNAEQHAQILQWNAEQHAREIQWNIERHAQELQRNANQHVRELQRNAEQHAREIHENTERYARELARLQRSDYDRRLPPELRGLRQWFSNRSKRRQRFIQDYHKIAASPLFDREWYLRRNPDVAAANVDAALHYLQRGGQEGRAPGPYFPANAYLKANPDVASAGANPLLHFLGRYKDGEEAV